MVNFGKRVDQNAIDVEEVECSGRVAMDHRSRDDVGITSHERMELERLSVNQQTGAINGTGPGVIRSTHYADQLPGLATPARRANPLPSSDAKLHFLRVDFQQGLTGNLINREITFLTRVRTVYGPVDSWEQELDGNRPEVAPAGHADAHQQLAARERRSALREPSQPRSWPRRTVCRWARCK